MTERRIKIPDEFLEGLQAAVFTAAAAYGRMEQAMRPYREACVNAQAGLDTLVLAVARVQGYSPKTPRLGLDDSGKLTGEILWDAPNEVKHG